MAGKGAVILGLVLCLVTAPAFGQFTVLDSAQDRVGMPVSSGGEAAAPPPAAMPACGNQSIAIAQMNWPSSMVLAQIHALLLAQEFGCDVRVVPGDPGATLSAMVSTGQPAVVPELWVSRLAEVWNGALETQMVRSAAPTFTETSFEGWFMPRYVADTFGNVPGAAGLAEVLPGLLPGEKMRFISCPPDWACSVINRNLIRAHGLAALVEIVEPANRLEMDRLIAEAVNWREPFLFYYWQPNAVLAQLDFTALDMGSYDDAAMKCLANRDCADPQPSAFSPDLVVMALAERVFVSTPQIAAYFQRASLSLADMNQLLAELNLPGATPDSVAERFVSEHADIWRNWVSSDLP